METIKTLTKYKENKIVSEFDEFLNTITIQVKDSNSAKVTEYTLNATNIVAIHKLFNTCNYEIIQNILAGLCALEDRMFISNQILYKQFIYPQINYILSKSIYL